MTFSSTVSTYTASNIDFRSFRRSVRLASHQRFGRFSSSFSASLPRRYRGWPPALQGTAFFLCSLRPRKVHQHRHCQGILGSVSLRGVPLLTVPSRPPDESWPIISNSPDMGVQGMAVHLILTCDLDVGGNSRWSACSLRRSIARTILANSSRK